jgi:hypothetical protein
MADDGRTSPPPERDRCRAAVRHVAQHAERPLTATELRLRALADDPSLGPIDVALAVAHLKIRGEIRVAP